MNEMRLLGGCVESRTQFKSETKRGRISKSGTSEKENNRGLPNRLQWYGNVKRRKEELVLRIIIVYVLYTSAK